MEKALNDLYVRIVQKLSISENQSEKLARILEDVCEQFGFGCGLIYQTDYTHTFYLKETFYSYEIAEIPASINLSAFFTNQELENLFEMSYFFSINTQSSKLLQLFKANTLFFVPIKNEENDFTSFIVLLDRRNRISLDEESLKIARTILTIVANSVKLRLYQQKVEDTKNSLLKVLDNMGIDIYVTDFETCEILYANKCASASYGGSEKILGKTCWSVFQDQPDQCDFCPKEYLVDQSNLPVGVYTMDHQRQRDGSWFRIFNAAFHWVDGRLAQVSSCVDITENKHNEALIRRMAEYDNLTNLPNRLRLYKDCQIAVKEMRDNKQEGYLIFFDLDNFKIVNDTMGHATGDALLHMMARTLQDNEAIRDCVYRHGGDEFVVLCKNTRKEKVLEIVDFILNLFRSPWNLGHYTALCQVSIGIAHYPTDGEHPDELINKADIAMYAAKHYGKNNAQFYDIAMTL